MNTFLVSPLVHPIPVCFKEPLKYLISFQSPRWCTDFQFPLLSAADGLRGRCSCGVPHLTTNVSALQKRPQPRKAVLLTQVRCTHADAARPCGHSTQATRLRGVQTLVGGASGEMPGTEVRDFHF